MPGLGRGAFRRRLRLLFPGHLDPGETEVEDLDPTLRGHEEVLGLQVPVDDPLLVRRGQALRDLPTILERLPLGKGAFREPLAKRLPCQKLRDGVGGVPVMPDIEEAQDVRMRERGDRLRLPLEPGERHRVARQRRRENLDRHFPVQPRVPAL